MYLQQPQQTKVTQTTTTTTVVGPTTTTTTVQYLQQQRLVQHHQKNNIHTSILSFTVTDGSGTLATVHLIHIRILGTLQELAQYAKVNDTVYTLINGVYKPEELNNGWMKMSNDTAISGYGASGVIEFVYDCSKPYTII